MTISACCQAPIKIRSAWKEWSDAVTNWYECQNCFQPCELLKRKGKMYLKIEFTDGTEIKEYYESFRIKEGCLILDKGGYHQPSKYINMAVVKSFEEDRQ